VTANEQSAIAPDDPNSRLGDDPYDFEDFDFEFGRTQVPRTDLRRMVLGLLINAGRPMTVSEITERVIAEGPQLWLQPGQRPSKIISDLLRQQVASKRVTRVKTGVYAIGKITPSMRWRSRHWYQLRWDVNSQQRRIIYRPIVPAKGLLDVGRVDGFFGDQVCRTCGV
jgi:hypothetical protein